ncbi:magnesium chelatase subunit D [Tropicibacter alexandrii]|uniref:magnesium chelatase subunit D n=1 Tax=Tropicibacter alexandrii TaxID=2267683 RepID=UPI000EF53B36|nr:magnesium chelatase subunit D [Tropicibacter alexandrii]
MTTAWASALRALSAVAVDPAGLGGLTLRARAGPVRQRFEDACGTVLTAPLHRLHPSDPDERLFGGLDAAGSLAARRVIRTKGLAAQPATLVLSMAERASAGYAARLARLLDDGRGHALILLDEGAEPDEQPPASLRDRLAFAVDLGDVSWREAVIDLPPSQTLARARATLPRIVIADDHRAALTTAAARLGIDSLRAPILALRAARALAVLDGQPDITPAHLNEAAALVLGPRATCLPDDAQPDPPPQTDAPEPGESPETTPSDMPPDDMIIAAVAAALPDGLLERLTLSKTSASSGSGAGAQRKGNRRGRSLPSRPGRLDGRSRIDLIATLRAAAPFQTLRRKARPDSAAKVIVTAQDIRLRRFEDRSDRLLIFAVDASGSAALARMAEAKGAVELFLARAYAKRDHVALIAFRGTSAEVLLSPTRSLVQAKRQLAALPGGGGTPLASGLEAALKLADTARHHGLSPALILLTDGRGNVALNGQPGRAEARADAETLATVLAREQMPGVVIDTANRPAEDGRALAGWLNARYLALPRADARALCQSAEAALGT